MVPSLNTPRVGITCRTWGDGFVTNSAVVQALNMTDPSSLLSTAVTRVSNSLTAGLDSVMHGIYVLSPAASATYATLQPFSQGHIMHHTLHALPSGYRCGPVEVPLSVTACDDPGRVNSEHATGQPVPCMCH